MKSGVIGVVEGDFNAANSVENTVTQGDHELQRVLDIQRVFSTPGGSMAFEGQAAVEVVRTRDVAEIDGANVEVSTERGKETRFANFVGIPGEFVVVDSGKGEYAFDLLAEETGTRIERSSVDVEQFFDDHENAWPWKAGFNEEDGDNQIFYGDDLQRSLDLEQLRAESTLNQLGVEYAYGGQKCKMTVTQTGYIGVYNPKDFDSGEFLDYVREELLQHVE